MDFVDKFVEIVFVTLAEIYKRLNCLVRICSYVLLVAFVDDLG